MSLVLPILFFALLVARALQYRSEAEQILNVATHRRSQFVVNRVELATVIHHKVRKFAVVPKVIELPLKGGVVVVFVVERQRFLRRRQQVIPERKRGRRLTSSALGSGMMMLPWSHLMTSGSSCDGALRDEDGATGAPLSFS